MTYFAKLQNHALAAVFALALSTMFVGASVLPAEVAMPVVQVA